MKKIAVVMGSDSDLPVVRPCLEVLRRFQVPYVCRVLSAHRTPDAAHELAASAREAGFGAIICFAGKAAHLAGVMAAGTTLPVIGVPVKSSTLDGLDALLATVQMPAGIPVATVAIDGGVNAGLLAVQMLSLEDPALAEALAGYKREMTEKVLEKDRKLQQEVE